MDFSLYPYFFIHTLLWLVTRLSINIVSAPNIKGSIAQRAQLTATNPTVFKSKSSWTIPATKTTVGIQNKECSLFEFPPWFMLTNENNAQVVKCRIKTKFGIFNTSRPVCNMFRIIDALYFVRTLFYHIIIMIATLPILGQSQWSEIMSADNSVVVYPYKTQSNESVWIVAEVSLSGLQYEMMNLVVNSRYRAGRMQYPERFKVLRGSSLQDALKVAREMEDKISAVGPLEYGKSVYEQEFTRESLCQYMVESGWNADCVEDLPELV